MASALGVVGKWLVVAGLAIPVLLAVAGKVYDVVDERRHGRFDDSFEQLDGVITAVILVQVGAVAVVPGLLLLLSDAIW